MIDFKKLRKDALSYAKSHHVFDPEKQEDFAQFYCLAILLGQHDSLKFQLVNFLRIEYGRTSKHSEHTRIKKNKFLPLDEEKFASPTIDIDQKILMSEVLKKAKKILTYKQKTILILYLRDFSQIEIAHILNITPSNVSIHLKNIFKKLKKSMKN